MPSSHDVQLAGHGWQLGPKNPDAQDSQDEPVNPVGQEHWPEEEQTPALEQGGVHAFDCISTSERLERPGI